MIPRADHLAVLVWCQMRAVWILIVCGLAAGSVSAQSPGSKAVSLPDVFLVTIDTLRADHVHCYGYQKIETPALDALAAEGVRFTEAFTPSPITNSSHTSILTGLWPSHHGVTDFAIPLAADHPTWAELLHAKGYHTAAFIGAVILDSKSLAPGLDRGFDFYDNFPEHPQTKSRWGRVERRGMDVVKDAKAWLNQHSSGPRFVWVHLYDPHDPYEPPPPFSETYKSRLYDGEIAYADSALGDFIQYLKTRGWYANAMIVVVGDHGEGLGQHGENTHGIFLYDSTLHVPLIVKLPRADNHGKTVSAQVRTTDLLPTVLDELHISTDSHFDGESLRPLLAAAQGQDRTAFGETDYPLRFGWAPLRSVRSDGFKFIEAPRPELYDLHADPQELTNIYKASNSEVQRLQAALAPIWPASNASPDQISQLPDPKDKIEEQNLLHTAMMASDDNRVEDARSALEQVLQKDPKSPTALRQLGELELNAREYSKAAEHLRTARVVRPDDATAAYYEGQAREKIGDFSGARDALEASLKLMPEQLPARLLLGNVYLKLKDARAAEDQFEAATLMKPESAEAQLGLAKAQIAERNFADAVSGLEPLSKSQPENAEVFELLGQAYIGLGKKQEAQQAQAKADALRKR